MVTRTVTPVTKYVTHQRTFRDPRGGTGLTHIFFLASKGGGLVPLRRRAEAPSGGDAEEGREEASLRSGLPAPLSLRSGAPRQLASLVAWDFFSLQVPSWQGSAPLKRDAGF